MADNYMEFSEVIPGLNQDEEAWLRSQLATVCVFGDREYADDQVPADLDRCEADWIGCRVYRDLPEYAESPCDTGGPGFEYSFNENATDGLRHLWIYAEDWANLDGAAQLVRKFLKRFRPDQCWSLTYANTCSKPRVGEFGGGAAFITADAIRWQHTFQFVEQERAAFEKNKSAHQEGNDLGQAIATHG